MDTRYMDEQVAVITLNVKCFPHMLRDLLAAIHYVAETATENMVNIDSVLLRDLSN